MRKPLIFLIAREYRQAQGVAERIGLRRQDWNFLDRPERLMGLHSFVLIRCGQAPQSEDSVRADLLAQEYEQMDRCTIMDLT